MAILRVVLDTNVLLEGIAYRAITSDKDLLALAEHYPIVTPAKFRATHAGL